MLNHVFAFSGMSVGVGGGCRWGFVVLCGEAFGFGGRGVGLSGLNSGGMELDVKNKLEGGLTFKVSRFKEVIKKTRPHKHDAYYELVFLSEGEGFHWIEEEEFRVTAPEFYLLQPGQVHYWQFTAVPKGFVVLFTEEIGRASCRERV